MTYAIGSVQGAMVASVFFLLLISAVEAVVLIKNRHRPLVGGAMTVATIGGYAAIWWWLWSGFYTVTVNADAVTLSKHLPARTVTLDRAEITSARWVPGYKNTWVLVVETTGGRYESTRASVPASDREAISSALERR